MKEMVSWKPGMNDGGRPYRVSEIAVFETPQRFDTQSAGATTFILTE
jgi:hypothetical protein